jgi:hypothetical protein
MLLHTTRIRQFVYRAVSLRNSREAGINQAGAICLQFSPQAKNVNVCRGNSLAFQKWMNLHGPLLGGLSYRTEPVQGYSPSIEYHNEALCKNPRQIQFFNF